MYVVFRCVGDTSVTITDFEDWTFQDLLSAMSDDDISVITLELSDGMAYLNKDNIVRIDLYNEEPVGWLRRLCTSVISAMGSLFAGLRRKS